MRKILLATAFFLFAIPFFSQEVIVFNDNRSLVVRSHREAGVWTYLTFEGGEMAVRTDHIKQIRKEGSEAEQSAKSASATLGVSGPSTYQPDRSRHTRQEPEAAFEEPEPPPQPPPKDGQDAAAGRQPPNQPPGMDGQPPRPPGSDPSSRVQVKPRTD